MQSKAGRAALLAALAAAAVVLFVVLSGGDDSNDDSGDTTESVTAVTSPAEPGTTDVVTPPTARITFKGGAAVGGPQKIEVTKGDEVDLAVSSDVDAEVHVHGYEIEKEVAAGKSVHVKFPADLDGVFEVEVHFGGDEAQVAELTVQPG